MPEPEPEPEPEPDDPDSLVESALMETAALERLLLAHITEKQPTEEAGTVAGTAITATNGCVGLGLVFGFGPFAASAAYPQFVI